MFDLIILKENIVSSRNIKFNGYTVCFMATLKMAICNIFFYVLLFEHTFYTVYYI